MTLFQRHGVREAFYNEFIIINLQCILFLEEDDKIVGYCGAWIVIDEAHVTNIAILPEYRGKSLGKHCFVK